MSSRGVLLPEGSRRSPKRHRALSPPKKHVPQNAEGIWGDPRGVRRPLFPEWGPFPGMPGKRSPLLNTTWGQGPDGAGKSNNPRNPVASNKREPAFHPVRRASRRGSALRERGRDGIQWSGCRPGDIARRKEMMIRMTTIRELAFPFVQRVCARACTNQYREDKRK